jgi:DNA topoisomerase-1
MSQGETLKKQAIAADQHFTEPPPRFSEASLVKQMEQLGIGRPSTYASILQVLKDRGYVRLEKKRLMPEDKGRVVVSFLENFFAKYVEYDFTAALEDQLDQVSNNELAWRDLLRNFWKDFAHAVAEIKDVRIGEVLDVLDNMLAPHIYPPRTDGSDPRVCSMCGTGRLSLRLGKFGAFIGCSNYPECKNTRPLSASGANGQDIGSKPLGKDPQTDLEVTLRSGRFGPYVQLGEASDGEKPKRAGLPKGTDPSAVDLEMALKLLSLPREVGLHPESGLPIKAGLGRFGPYVQHEKTYASLESPEDVFTVGLNHAVTLIAEKIAKGPSKRGFGADPGKVLGDHPQKGGPVTVKKGRYGPYVTHNGVNATLPSDQTPETITLPDAVALLDTRAARSGDTPRPRRQAGRKSPAKTVAGEAAAKKPPAKIAAKSKSAAKPRAAKPRSTAAKAPPKGKAKTVGKVKAAR